MLGNIRLADILGVLEIAYAFHTLSKFFKNLDAHGVGNDFEKIDSLKLQNPTLTLPLKGRKKKR